jgi:hypothetical protein
MVLVPSAAGLLLIGLVVVFLAVEPARRRVAAWTARRLHLKPG